MTTGTESWTHALRSAIRSVAELLDVVELDPAELVDAAVVDAEFPLLVPRGFAARMRKRDPHDPLLRQVLPIRREHDRVPGFTRDPLAEVVQTTQGVMRKYAGRALLITTAACPIHCRYCFRRHFPYAAQTASHAAWAPAVDALAAATDVSEVILSGGDPLTLSNRRLAVLLHRLEALGHLETLRIHTRYPIVLPQRIDTELLSMLSRSRLRTVVVVHCNHAQEIDAVVALALARLQSSRITLLNQSVLLRGVNDDVETLRALSRRLHEVAVLPYYLHMLDRVDGVAHFDVPEHTARRLVRELRDSLPGYLVPRLARESAGGLSKTVLA